jgi:hypothetical protein
MIISFKSFHIQQVIKTPFTQHCRQCVFPDNLRLAEIGFKILPSEQTWIKCKKEKIINDANQKEDKSQSPYKYTFGDQVSLETPGILRILSPSCTGSFPAMDV